MATVHPRTVARARDVNTALQDALLRRAALATRYENASERQMRQRLAQTTGHVLDLVRGANLLTKERLPFGLVDHGRQARFSSLLKAIALVLGQYAMGNAQQLRDDLQAQAALELTELPHVVNATLKAQSPKVKLQEAASGDCIWRTIGGRPVCITTGHGEHAKPGRHVYHTTSLDRLASIAKSGLSAGQASQWAGVSSTGISLSPTETIAKDWHLSVGGEIGRRYRAAAADTPDEQGTPVALRIRPPKRLAADPKSPATGSVITNDAIPSDHIEFWHPSKGWLPISRYSEAPKPSPGRLGYLGFAPKSWVISSVTSVQEAAADIDPEDRDWELPLFKSVPAAQVTELLGTPLGGAFFQQSFADLAASLLSSVRNVLLWGLTTGQGIAPVARKLQGVLGNARWQAERIVRSEFIRAANQAALTTFSQNEDTVDSVQWVATLDAATCCPAGTWVTLADGSALPIEQVIPGRLVQTRAGARRVTETLRRRYDGPLCVLATDQSVVPVTADHPIWTGARGWVAAIDLHLGEPVLEETGQARRGQDVVLAQVDDQPPALQQAPITARLTLRIALPVVAVHFESNVPGRESEVYRVTPHSVLPEETHPQASQRPMDALFECGRAAMATIAAEGAERPMARQWARTDAVAATTVAAALDQGRPTAALRAVLPVGLATEDTSAGPAALQRLRTFAGPGAHDVAIGITSAHGDLAARRAGLRDAPGDAPQIASSIAEDLLLALRAEEAPTATADSGLGSGVCVVAGAGTELRGSFSGLATPELLAAALACVRSCQGRHLRAILAEFLHQWDGHVYNVEVDGAHEYLVNGVLVHNCLQCGVLDGRTWENLAAAPIPVTDTHPNCRCILVPVVKDADSLGLPPASRASFSGQVPATLDYADWFERQDPAFQREVLGPRRFELYQSDRASLGDFATASGVRRVRDVLADFEEALALLEYNPNHAPAGSPEGGQFTSGPGGGVGAATAEEEPATPGEWRPKQAADRARQAKLEALRQEGIDKVEGLFEEIEGTSVTVEGGGAWDDLDDSDKEQIESNWIDEHENDYYDAAKEDWELENFVRIEKEMLKDREWGDAAIRDALEVSVEDDGLRARMLARLDRLDTKDRQDLFTGNLDLDQVLSRMGLDDPAPEGTAFFRSQAQRTWKKELDSRIAAELEGDDAREWIGNVAREKAQEAWGEQSPDALNDLAAAHTGGPVGGRVRISEPDTWTLSADQGDAADYRMTHAIAKTLMAKRAEQLWHERYPDKPLPDFTEMDDDFWNAWKRDSFHSDTLRMHSALVAEFGANGGREAAVAASKGFSAVAPHLEAEQVYARALWDTTQFLLDKKDLSFMPLYRAVILPGETVKDLQKITGIDPAGAANTVGHTKLPTLALQQNPAQSFTFDRKVANTWSGVGSSPSGGERVVLRAMVPATAVWSVPVFGENVHNEKEAVILGTPWQKWDAWLQRAPSTTRLMIEWLLREARVERSIITQDGGRPKPDAVVIDLADPAQTGGQHWLWQGRFEGRKQPKPKTRQEYREDQPRDPKGSPTGGQWTGGDGAATVEVNPGVKAGAQVLIVRSGDLKLSATLARPDAESIDVGFLYNTTMPPTEPGEQLADARAKIAAPRHLRAVVKAFVATVRERFPSVTRITADVINPRLKALLVKMGATPEGYRLTLPLATLAQEALLAEAIADVFAEYADDCHWITKNGFRICIRGAHATLHANEPLAFVGTLGIPRADMPQISNQVLDEFEAWGQAQGVGMTREAVPVQSLRPAQVSVNPAQVAQMPDAVLRGTIIVSDDGYVLNGTNRWARLMQQDPEGPVNVLRVGLSARPALDLMRRFPKAGKPKTLADLGATAATALKEARDLEEAEEPCRWVTIGGRHICISPGHGQHAANAPVEITTANVVRYMGHLKDPAPQADLAAIAHADTWSLFDRVKYQAAGASGLMLPIESLVSPKNELADAKFLAGQKPDPRITAAHAMVGSVQGKNPARAPITVVRRPDGRYLVQDGNATVQVLMLAGGWRQVPAQLVTAKQEAAAAADDCHWITYNGRRICIAERHRHEPTNEALGGALPKASRYLADQGWLYVSSTSPGDGLQQAVVYRDPETDQRVTVYANGHWLHEFPARDERPAATGTRLIGLKVRLLKTAITEAAADDCTWRTIPGRGPICIRRGHGEHGQEGQRRNDAVAADAEARTQNLTLVRDPNPTTAESGHTVIQSGHTTVHITDRPAATGKLAEVDVIRADATGARILSPNASETRRALRAAVRYLASHGYTDITATPVNPGITSLMQRLGARPDPEYPATSGRLLLSLAAIRQEALEEAEAADDCQWITKNGAHICLGTDTHRQHMRSEPPRPHEARPRPDFTLKTTKAGDGLAHQIMVDGKRVGHISGFEEDGAFHVYKTELSDHDYLGTGLYQAALQQVADRYPRGAWAYKWETSPAFKKAIPKLPTHEYEPERERLWVRPTTRQEAAADDCHWITKNGAHICITAGHGEHSESDTLWRAWARDSSAIDQGLRIALTGGQIPAGDEGYNAKRQLQRLATLLRTDVAHVPERLAALVADQQAAIRQAGIGPTVLLYRGVGESEAEDFAKASGVTSWTDDFAVAKSYADLWSEGDAEREPRVYRLRVPIEAVIASPHGSPFLQREREWLVRTTKRGVPTSRPVEAGPLPRDAGLTEAADDCRWITYQGRRICIGNDRHTRHREGDPIVRRRQLWGGATAEERGAFAHELADKYGVPRARVVLNEGNGPERVVDGQTFYEAGHYDPSNQSIVLFADHRDTEELDRIMAHESGHAAFHEFTLQAARERNAIQTYVAHGPDNPKDKPYTSPREREVFVDPIGSDRLKGTMQAKWPARYALANFMEDFHGGRAAVIQFGKSVSPYTALWWQAVEKGTAPLELAINETLAEMRLNSPRGGDPDARQTWADLFTAVNTIGARARQSREDKANA